MILVFSQNLDPNVIKMAVSPAIKGLQGLLFLFVLRAFLKRIGSTFRRGIKCDFRALFAVPVRFFTGLLPF